MKIAALFLSVVLILTLLSGCTKDGSVLSSSDVLSHTEESSSSEVSSLAPSSSEPTVSSSSQESSSSVPSKVEVSSVPPAPSSKPVPSSAPAVSSSSAPAVSKVKMYEVTDPKNERGLSTARNGYGFGIAENEEPPQMSLDNQTKFDGLKGVRALALDTKTEEKVMYLTFDNGYEYKNLTGKILDVLKEKKVKAAFFPTLSYIKNNGNFIKRMIDEGHIVGNHSATHPDFSTISRTEMANEIYLVDKYLQDNFGYKSYYFRFPSGAHSECALELVTSVGFKSIFWSVAYGDWDTGNQKGTQYAIDTVTSRFHPGAVILLHAVSVDNANALSAIIDKAHEMGYRFATLDEYFK